MKNKKDDDMPKSILFVQHTPDSGLAKELRKMIQDLKPWTRISIKVVERAGERLEDILHKSNPWEGIDCGRDDCLLCLSSSKEERKSGIDCTKRNVVYETWCQTCRDIKKKEIEKEGATGNKRKKEREVDDYRYIGETARSSYERGIEHCKDLEYFRNRSHMLKHIVLRHQDMQPKEVEFRMKVCSQHKTAFERQITEAVLIRNNSGPGLLNSKLEYNRCYIPKIVIEKREKESKEKDVTIEEETKAIDKIKILRSKFKKRNVGGVSKAEEDRINDKIEEVEKKMINLKERKRRGDWRLTHQNWA